mgnify:CR=1 FL=1
MIVFGPVPSRRLGRSVGINNMNITAVHPMKKPAVDRLLQKNNCDWYIINKLIDEQRLIKFEYQGETFYMRKLISRF